MTRPTNHSTIWAPCFDINTKPNEPVTIDAHHSSVTFQWYEPDPSGVGWHVLEFLPNSPQIEQRNLNFEGTPASSMLMMNISLGSSSSHAGEVSIWAAGGPLIASVNLVMAATNCWMLDSRLMLNPTLSLLLSILGKFDVVGVEDLVRGPLLVAERIHGHNHKHRSWSFSLLLFGPVYVSPTVRVPNR